MGWEITWRVLSGPGGAQERPEPFAIEGEVLEFRLGHSVALHERAGHRAGFWSREEPFSLWITGTRRVGPIRGTEERPHVLRYNFAYPGEKRLQFGGVPAPVGEFREPHPAGDVLVNLGWQVFPTNSPTAVEVRNRAARPGRGAAVATSTGSSSRSAARDAAARRQEERAQAALDRQRQQVDAARRTQAMEQREASLRARHLPLDRDGFFPVELRTPGELDRMEAQDVADYAERLHDMLAVTPTLDLRSTPLTLYDQSDRRFIPTRVHWRVAHDGRSVRFWQVPLPTGNTLLSRETRDTWRSDTEISFREDDLLLVRLPQRDAPALMMARDIPDEILEDQVWATVEFAAWEVVGIVFPVEAIVGRLLVRLIRRVASPAVRRLVRFGAPLQRGFAAASPSSTRGVPRLAREGAAARRAARSTSGATRGIPPGARGRGGRGTAHGHVAPDPVETRPRREGWSRPTRRRGRRPARETQQAPPAQSPPPQTPPVQSPPVQPPSVSPPTAPASPTGGVNPEVLPFLSEQHRTTAREAMWRRRAALNPHRTDESTTWPFREWSLDRILGQPGHPLLPLVNERTGNYFPSQGFTHQELLDYGQVQMGHLTSRFSGEPERLALQLAVWNQVEGQAERQGVVFVREAVSIGGVPVERETALVLERAGMLPAGTVAAAPRSSGWAWDEWVGGSAGITGHFRWEYVGPGAP